MQNVHIANQATATKTCTQPPSLAGFLILFCRFTTCHVERDAWLLQSSSCQVAYLSRPLDPVRQLIPV